MAAFHTPLYPWPSEVHEAFAASLALILPDPMSHVDGYTGSVTPTIILTAREGGYAPSKMGVYETPFVFESPQYAGHLRKEIRALMRAYYPEANLPEE